MNPNIAHIVYASDDKFAEILGVSLIQHISQLNFLLTSIDKEPEKPKRKIGFRIPDDE